VGVRYPKLTAGPWARSDGRRPSMRYASCVNPISTSGWLNSLGPRGGGTRTTFALRGLISFCETENFDPGDQSVSGGSIWTATEQ